MKGSTLELIALILVVLGGLNWGLVGLLDVNLVTAIFGGVANLVYDLVGVAAVYVGVNLVLKKGK